MAAKKFGEQVSMWDTAMLNGRTAIIFSAGRARVGGSGGY